MLSNHSHMNNTHIIYSSQCSRHMSSLSFGNYLATADLGWVSLVCAINHLVPCVNIIISTAINTQKNPSFILKTFDSVIKFRLTLGIIW